MKLGRQPPFVLAEEDVARAHRQAVWLAHHRTGHDLGVEKERRRHVAYQNVLLPVLLSEVGAVGPDDREELEDHS